MLQVVVTTVIEFQRAGKLALATSYAYVNPVVAVALGALFAGEQVTTRLLTGMAVILAGVALVMVGSTRKK